MDITYRDLSEKDSAKVLHVLYDEFGLVYTDNGDAVHGRNIIARRECIKNGRYNVSIYSGYFDQVGVLNLINRCCNLDFDL